MTKTTTFYVKYPPEGDDHFRAPTVERKNLGNGSTPAEWKPCTYGIEPEYANAKRDIENCRRTWDATGSRLYVIEAFRIATAAKLYPPLWVLDELNERFTDALRNDRSLDYAFGFSGKGLGSGRRLSAKAEDRLLQRNFLFCLAIFKLEAAGLTLGQASDALASSLAQHSIAVGGSRAHALARMRITGKGIRKGMDDYSKRFPDVYAQHRAETMDAARTWTVEERRELLLPFFPGGIPIVLSDGN